VIGNHEQRPGSRFGTLIFAPFYLVERLLSAISVAL
jgi:hypothetical protein